MSEHEVRYNNDMVPDKWKSLFTNEEWLMHEIVVRSTYGGAILSILVHIGVWFWQPWLVTAG